MHVKVASNTDDGESIDDRILGARLHLQVLVVSRLVGDCIDRDGDSLSVQLIRIEYRQHKIAYIQRHNETNFGDSINIGLQRDRLLLLGRVQPFLSFGEWLG